MDRAAGPPPVVVARLAAHSLARRADRHDLLEVVGRCGMQNSPPGSALLSVHARVRDVDIAGFEALVESRELLQTLAMRGAPYFVPAADAAVFTRGVLPTSEAALRHLLPGVVPAVEQLDVSVLAMADLCEAHIGSVLDGRQLAIGELGRELAAEIASDLATAQRTVWNREGPYAPGQPWGEAVVHFCLRVLALRQVVCFAARQGNRAPFVLVTQWLGTVPPVEPHIARAELLRRYLRCYGPSTRAGFAAWIGVHAADVADWWDLIGPNQAEVVVRVEASGVRLLPPHDPYLQVPDRQTIVAPSLQRLVWPRVGPPGVVLSDGLVVGIWRAHKKGRRLVMKVELFAACGESLEVEAQAVARLRGADSVVLSVSR